MKKKATPAGAYARGQPLVVAHRGAWRQAPAPQAATADLAENSLPAFERALRLGADGVELDLWRCASGELVVHHDQSLQRMTGDPRRVDRLTLTQLRALRLPGQELIPTLAEVLELCKEARLINLELKVEGVWPTGLERALVAVLARQQVHARLLISCFHPVALFRLQHLSPSLGLGLLFGCEQAFPFRHAWHRAPLRLKALHPEHPLLTPEKIERWHRAGLEVNVWTVDQPERTRELMAWGVDALITNAPASAVSLRDAAEDGEADPGAAD